MPNNFGIKRNRNGISERSMICAVLLVSESVVTPEPDNNKENINIKDNNSTT